MLQKILIQHHQIQLPEADKGQLSTPVLATVMSNISYYGYALSLQAYAALASCDERDVFAWWEATEPVFKALTGDDKDMADFVVYKNFPQEVLEMSESEYWLKQLFMYWGFPNEMFSEAEVEREALDEELSLKALHPANSFSLPRIATSMLQMPNRWTDGQWDDLKQLVAHWRGLPPEEREAWKGLDDLSSVSFKENMAQLAGYFLSEGYDAQVGSATDVLRLAAWMSDGDVSLREKSKFRTFRRKERKFLLATLETASHLHEDLLRHKNTWKKLMFGLRPGDYAKRFPRVVEAYDKLYNDQLPQTFASKVEAYLQQSDAQVLSLLQSRPGEFVRRLHHCVSVFGHEAAEAFVDDAVLRQLQTVQLLKVYRYVETINGRSFRTFAPKGNWTKLQIAENPASRKLPEQTKSLLLQQLGAELQRRLQPEIPMVELDPNTAWVKLQTNDGDLSPYGRGTIFPIPEKIRFLRTAAYWKTGPTAGNIWYDNGWNFFDAEWKNLGACCWNLAHFGDNAAIFSGDPTNSKEMEGRACQMIDLYIDELQKRGVRYAVWNILCYSKIAFDDAEEVYAALQWGENPQKGKLFEPSRCQLSFPLQGANFTKYIAYVDLELRQVVYMDANLYGNVSSAGANGDTLAKSMPAFVEYLQALPSVYDLFRHQPQGEDGMPVLYSDKDRDLQGKAAYVFRPESQHSSFEPFDIQKPLAAKGHIPKDTEESPKDFSEPKTA